MTTTDPIAVRCAVCHSPAGRPCQKLGEYHGHALPYPHRGRGDTLPSGGSCPVAWDSGDVNVAGLHECSLERQHGAQQAEENRKADGFHFEYTSTDHVCRCGDRFSHAAAVGMSS